jgi:threonyl-tRNA synthetase
MQEEAPGMVFWHPRAGPSGSELEQYMRGKVKRRLPGSERPQMMDRVLWERSGHWEKYAQAMFTTQSENATTPSSR